MKRTQHGARKRRRCWAAAVALSLLSWTPWPARGSADEAPAVAGLLRSATWEARAAGEHWTGSACWLRAAQDELRVDVARHPTALPQQAPAWDRLLARAGEGWTAVLGAQGAVIGRWGEAFTAPEPALTLRLQVLLALLEAGPDGSLAGLPVAVEAGREPPGRRGAGLGWRCAGDPSLAPWRLCLPEAGRLCERAQTRGRGRGGAGEVWRVAWTNAGEQPPRLHLRSSRTPGALTVWPTAVLGVTFAPEEAFVPFWGLAEVLAFPAGSPAPSGAGQARQAR